MSKTISKIVSLMCSMCLIMSVCFTQSAYAMTETPASGSGITESDIPSNYKWLTASDFHSNGSEFGNTYNSADTDYIHDLNSTLDKTVFTAKVKFSKTGENRIYIGGSWKGVFFQGAADGIRLFKADGSHIMTFTDDIAGCQLTENNDLKLTVSFEFLNSNDINTDLKIGVFLNGWLYQNKYIEATGFSIADLKQFIKLYVNDSSLIVKSVTTPIPAYLEDYTTTTIGLNYAQQKFITNSIGRTNVGGTLFGMRVTFNKENSFFQYGGNGSGWYGIRFQLSGDNLYVGSSTSELLDLSGKNAPISFNPKIAFGDGTTSFIGKTFDLHISTETVNHDGKGNMDVRYGFYFNGKLYNDTFVYSYNTALSVGNYVGFQHSNSEYPTFLPTGSISNKTIDESATQLSVNDITADSNICAYNVIHPAYARMGTYKAASNFNNTVFGANVTLTHGGNAQTFFQIGGSGEWDGIRFKVEGKNLVIESAGVTSTTVMPDFIGAETFNGTPTTIALSTEIANLDGGETSNDVIYGIYIGGRFYTKLFAYNQADNLANRVVFNNWCTGSTFSTMEKTNRYTIPEELKEISFSDFSILDGTYNNSLGIIGEYSNTDIENLTEAVFTGYVTFSPEHATEQGKTSPQSTVCYAALSEASDGSDGIRISNHHQWVPTSDGVLDVSFFGSQHVQLLPEIAGTELVGKQIKLQIVILPADFNGEDTDALIGIIINDRLYNETLFKVVGGLENVGTYTRIYTNGTYITVASPSEKMPEDLVTLTPKEFGVEGTWNCVGNSGVKYGEVTSNYTSENHSGSSMSLMGKTISMDIEYSGENYIHFAAPDMSSWYGLRIKTATDSIKIESSIQGTGACDSIICTSDNAGVDFTKKFNLKITVERYDSENAKIGVWFNDKLYGNRYLKWNGVADKLNASVNVIPYGGGNITLSAPETNIPTADDGYTCKTLTDYGFSYKTYTGNSESKNIAGLSTDKIVVSGKLALTGNGHMVLLGDWLGYYLGIDWESNNVVLKHSNGIFTNPIMTPLNDVANGQFTFDLVQTAVDADYDGEKDDIQLELWIDGNYTRDYFFMDYAQSATSEYSRVFPDGGSVTVKSEIVNETENGVYYNLADGAYLVTAVTTDSNGKTYNIGDEINIAGDYTVTSAVGSTKSEYYVYLWKQGDYHPDGQSDIRDLVALKKHFAGIEITKSGAKAAGLCISEATGLIECRKVLLGISQYGKVNTALHYSVDSAGGAVMPISGFWGPRKIESSLSGAEKNMIQDKYYSLISDMGVNLINYIETDAGNGQKSLMDIMQNLSLAEKYNIGIYVNDSAVNESMTNKELAQRLSLYSKYSSFRGVHVYDEPITDTYNPNNSTSQKKISDISGVSKLLNKFSNLSAYINLLPSITGDNKYYPYLIEYNNSCSPKVISYDNYPFTSGRYYGETGAHTSYFNNLEDVRTFSNLYNVPFWSYVQCGNNFSLETETTTNFVPSKSQFLWNINTALAYGAKGIQYFPLIQPNYYGAVEKDENGNIISQDFGRNGLIGANGEKTRWYEFAKEANSWIAMVDNVLMNCASKEIIACGSYAKTATGKSESYGETTVSSNNSDGFGAIVGVFDYNGKTAYYVVNNRYYVNYDELGEDTITLTFSSSKNATVYEASGIVSEQQTNSLSLNVKYGCAALVITD